MPIISVFGNQGVIAMSHYVLDLLLMPVLNQLSRK